MYHRTRWTPEKIKQRLELITPLVTLRRKSLASFRYRELDNALTPPPVGREVDDSDWREIDAGPAIHRLTFDTSGVTNWDSASTAS